MAWQDKQTASSAFVHTREWRNLRLRILERDHNRCQLRHLGCLGTAIVVDKITAIAEGGDPRDPNNLRSVCEPCHNIETQKQARRGRNSWKRQPEKHPGLRR